MCCIMPLPPCSHHPTPFLAAAKYQNFTTDISEAYGEVAGVLLKVAKYAWEKFGIGDVLFGVYHLAQVGNPAAACMVCCLDGHGAALWQHPWSLLLCCCGILTLSRMQQLLTLA
jgi:hypothetical protein